MDRFLNENSKINLKANKRVNLLSYKRLRDSSLDFKGIPASSGINSIHSYPAMFHPKLIRKYLDMYSADGDLVLDPFMGSGVSAVESCLKNRRFIGFDINPLATLIAKVRTTPIEYDKLRKSLDFITDNYYSADCPLPDFKNINFWFSPERITAISKLLAAIEQLQNSDIKDFFKIVVSQTIRTVSRTKPNEFKLVRRKKPCCFSTLFVFRNVAIKNINVFKNNYLKSDIKHTPQIYLLNVYKDKIPLKNNSISLLITSPPYGDSQTTVAYGQFSRLSLQWLTLPHNTDSESLGAKGKEITPNLPSCTIYESLMKIKGIDEKRAKQVYSFYDELYTCLIKLVPKIKIGGYAVLVVGNRMVKNTILPTDKICAEMLEHLGCTNIETRVRLIGNKRMPAANSPSNIRGEKLPTMKAEYIVVSKKSN